MKILITGADGFVGRNLKAALEAIRDNKDRTHPGLLIEQVETFTRRDDPETLKRRCEAADFIFHLAGINRPSDPAEFDTGNRGLTEQLVGILREQGRRRPLMLASSIQASLTGPYAGSPYGQSKRDAEELVFRYGRECGAPTAVYRFPNLFGKWCRPRYNSVVATFCDAVAHDRPIEIHDPKRVLELAYIDDVVEELIGLLMGKEHRDGSYCYVPVTHRASLAEIADWLYRFDRQPKELMLPPMREGSFEKKLYSTYLSYLPAEKAAFPLKMNADARGSFTELLKTEDAGQFSVNITKPGVTKGQHWHHSKWEFFIVVSGRGLIRERRLDSEEVFCFEVSGEKIEAVHMLPGYTHSITNLSDTEDLVTLMWANECFDPSHPDTFAETV